MPEFPVDGPTNATIRISSGSLRITAEARDSVAVDVRPGSPGDAARQAAAETIVEMTADGLIIETPQARGFLVRRTPSLNVSVRVPTDSQIMVRTASADVVCDGRFGSADINTASGDLQIEDVTRDFTRHSASGDTRFGRIGGDMTANSASGDVRGVSVAGELTFKSASGDVTIDAVGDSVHAATASGDIELGNLARGNTRITTASGDVRIGVAEGTSLWMDINTLSGDTRSDLAVSDAPPTGGTATLELSARTVSGDVTLHRAMTAPAPRATTPRADTPRGDSAAADSDEVAD
jgi:putative adhesin